MFKKKHYPPNSKTATTSDKNLIGVPYVCFNHQHTTKDKSTSEFQLTIELSSHKS